MDDTIVRPAVRASARGKNTRARPKVILICSPKGGCGKTTLTRAMLVRAAQMGRHAVGLDFDQQRTLTKWFRRRPNEGKENLRVEEIDFHQWSTRLFDLQNEVDETGRLIAEIVVIDTPPSVEMAMGTFKAMIEKADIVLVPTQPSEDDIESVEPWMLSVKALNPKAAFVLSRINKQARSTTEAQVRLLEAGRLCPILIPDSEEVRRAHAAGCTVLDLTGLRTDTAKRFEGIYNFVAQEIGV